MSTALVVAAHGSRAVEANDAHRAAVADLAATVEVPVAAAFLELADPSIGDAIDGAIAAGAHTVLVLPYFLYPGRHLTRDIPAIVDEAIGRHPGADIRLLGLFGAQPGLAEALAAQVRDALG